MPSHTQIAALNRRLASRASLPGLGTIRLRSPPMASPRLLGIGNAPLQRILKPVISPENLVAHGESRGAKDAKFPHKVRLSLELRAYAIRISQRSNVLNTPPERTYDLRDVIG
jgi:hypothetical protein